MVAIVFQSCHNGIFPWVLGSESVSLVLRTERQRQLLDHEGGIDGPNNLPTLGDEQ